MRSSLAFALSVTFLALAGCTAAVGSPGAPGVSSSDLAGGCHEVCPRCLPHQMCPLIACRLDCNAHQTCTQNQLCIIGYQWNRGACQCVPSPTPTACQSDADCYTESNTCDGTCSCTAQRVGSTGPSCGTPTTTCSTDPCDGVTAVCLHGSCSLQ